MNGIIMELGFSLDLDSAGDWRFAIGRFEFQSEGFK